MNKETILKDLSTKMQILQGQIESVNRIELKVLYKYNDRYYDPSARYSANPTEYNADTYGYFECFNRESARFVVLSTNSPLYADKKSRDRRGYIKALNYVSLSGTSWKQQALVETKISSLISRLTPVMEKDLPLLIGMKYQSPELERVLKGKRKLKYKEAK